MDAFRRQLADGSGHTLTYARATYGRVGEQQRHGFCSMQTLPWPKHGRLTSHLVVFKRVTDTFMVAPKRCVASGAGSPGSTHRESVHAPASCRGPAARPLRYKLTCNQYVSLIIILRRKGTCAIVPVYSVLRKESPQ